MEVFNGGRVGGNYANEKWFSIILFDIKLAGRGENKRKPCEKQGGTDPRKSRGVRRGGATRKRITK